MRLTLRTLLAWLDDTLPPAEVRAIGKQVAESPFAKELVERIQKVTRQRRLTVPGETGADGADPNLVAAYLDNELDADSVGEFEKKCLTSDVHLAEVASTHQILSLIGQKAKVPPEARHRMYQLIVGRESTHRKAAPAGPRKKPPTENVSRPVQEWVRPEPPRRHWSERFGPIAAVLALIAVLCWSAWVSMKPSPQPDTNPPALALANGARPDPAVPLEPAPKPAPDGNTEAEKAKSAEPKLAATEANPPDPLAPDAKHAPAPAAPPDDAPKAKPGTTLPPGALGVVVKPDGLLLGYNAEKREWERLGDAAPVREGERLLSLTPFRTRVDLGEAKLDMIGETEVTLNPSEPGQVARIDLTLGRVVLRGGETPTPLEVRRGDTRVTVTPAPGQAVGIERVTRRAPGEATVSPPALRVFVGEGQVALQANGGTATTLDGPGSVTLDPTGAWSDTASGPAPDWVKATGPTAFEQKVGEQFLAFFRPDRPVIPGLVEASEDREKDVCLLAIAGLRAVGDISYVIPILNRRNSPNASEARRAAIEVLRAELAEGGDAEKALGAQLRNDLGEGVATATEKLLIGYNAKEARDPATVSKLVQVLGTTDEGDLGLRELALDSLKAITGRDDMGYDPEKPEGKGLKAWKDLARERESAPAPGTAPARVNR